MSILFGIFFLTLSFLLATTTWRGIKASIALHRQWPSNASAIDYVLMALVALFMCGATAIGLVLSFGAFMGAVSWS